MARRKKPKDKNKPWRDFRSYKQSPAWFKKRDRALEHYRYCEYCGETEKLEVFHRDYRRLYREDNSDLIVLCPACHVKRDQNMAGDTLSHMADQYMRVMGLKVSNGMLFPTKKKKK